jgi:hypothetical protein
MAAVEPLGSADPMDPTQWFIVRGTLKEADLEPLLEGTGTGGRGNVTLDLLDLDTLTPGGCWTIRNLAEDLWHRGRLLTVVFRDGDRVAEVLRSTRTIGHRHTVFRGSIAD